MLVPNTLLHLCSDFLKQASLKEDLAKRILYSIIPAVQSPTERQFSNNYIQLKAAAAGATDLIFYGTQACIEELSHFGADALDRVPEEKATELFLNGQYLKALSLCVQTFNSPNWKSDFGGKPWAKIADTLRQLTLLQTSLLKNRQIPRSIENLEQETAIMKDIIIQMNVFDGLAHNTRSVMHSLLRHENLDTDNPKPTEEPEVFTDEELKNYQREQQETDRLMDAKELNNPFDVYKQVSDLIEQPSNLAPFKDFVSRIRSHPDFLKPSDPNHEFLAIRRRKEFKIATASLSRFTQELIDTKDKFLNSNDQKTFYYFYRLISQISSIHYHYLNDLKAMFADLSPEISPICDNAIALTNYFISAVVQPSEQATSIEWGDYNSENSLSNIDPKFIPIIKSHTNEIISIAHQIKRLVSKLNSISETI